MESKVCKACKVEKNVDQFEKGRNQCKECRSTMAKKRREKQKEENLVWFKCKEMAYSAHARVTAPSRKYKGIYQDIEEPFGFDTVLDFAQFVYDNFGKEVEQLLDAGKIPSLDRKDTSKGYTPDNVQILDFVENTRRGIEASKSPVKVTTPEGEELLFESVVECSEYFGTSESHVRMWLSGKHAPKNRCVFEYVGKNRRSS